jgi:hypothetical protein
MGRYSLKLEEGTRSLKAVTPDGLEHVLTYTVDTRGNVNFLFLDLQSGKVRAEYRADVHPVCD